MKFTIVKKSSGKKAIRERVCVGWTPNRENILYELQQVFANVKASELDDYEVRVYFKDFVYPDASKLRMVFNSNNLISMGVKTLEEMLAKDGEIKEWHKSLLRRSLFRKHIHEDEDGEYFVMHTTRFDDVGRNMDYPLNCVQAALIRNPVDYTGGVWSFYYKTIGSRKSATMLLVACSLHHGQSQSHSTFLPRENFYKSFAKGGKAMDVIRDMVNCKIPQFSSARDYFNSVLPIGPTSPYSSVGRVEECIKFLRGDKK